ncbi:hypothetical protein ACFX13_004207 [Malus domestica]
MHTTPTTGNVFSMVRGVRHTSPKTPLKLVRAKHKLAVGSHVRMKKKASSMSFCQRRQRNLVFSSFSATPSLPLVPLLQAQEQTSPTNRSRRTPIAIRKGTDKHMHVVLRRRLDADWTPKQWPWEILHHHIRSYCTRGRRRQCQVISGANEFKVLRQSFEFDNIV